MSDSIVSLRHVEKWYGNNHVVKDMNLEIQEGEFLTLLGPSGCGKTTTLRMIAGFENATSGTIEVQGQRVEEKEPYERDVNTVFQNYSLFPHMTVFDNVAYGPSIRKVPKDEIKRRVTEMLALVQMSGYEKRKPDALSGGQKQRVAIARALINNPRVLLLDEPLGALDLKLRKQMQIELKRLQKKLGITFVYVTHDQEEAMTMSDRIAVMRDGVILQMDAPAKIYDRPNCRFVADFIGESNVISGVVRSVEGEKLSVETPDGMILACGEGFTVGEKICVSVRSEYLNLSATPVEGFTLRGKVKDFIYVGAASRRCHPRCFRGRGAVMSAPALTKKRRLPALAQAGPVSLWMILFVTAPLLFIIYISFMSRGPFGGVVYEFTTESYATLLDTIYFEVILKSFKVALTTTVVCLLLGYPFAYYIARKPSDVAAKLIMLLMIPMWTNSLMRLNAWMLLFQTNGPVNNLLMAMHIIDSPIMFIYSDGLVMLGLITNYLPFAVLPMYASIEKLENHVLEASADLGAVPRVTFFRVTLPLTFPGIFSAIILTFIPALGTYTITDMLGGGKVLYIGNIIKNQFGIIRNWPLGAALSVLLLAITALLIFIYSRFAKIEDMEVL